jgi:hypothetical protein
MRRLSLLFFGLCLAPSVHAALFISVNGVIEPPFAEVNLQPDETAVIGIHGDGWTMANIVVYLLVEGPGSIDGHTMVYPGSLSAYEDLEAFADSFGRSPEDMLVLVREEVGKTNIQDVSYTVVADWAIPPAPLKGLLVDDIIFQCGGFGDVKLTLMWDDYADTFPTQVIHQVPEPGTLFLLGLGIFLMRRKRSL